MKKSKRSHITFGGVSFQVEHAKLASAEGWISERLRRKVYKARRSYLRYGKVPITDRDDRKSDIFLVRASMNKQGKPWEEWMCVRFIQESDLNLDEAARLLQCNVDDEAFLKVFHEEEALGPCKVAIVSRICGIPASPKSSPEGEPARLSYTPWLFALAVNEFFNQVKAPKEEQLLVGIFRDELVEKGLTTRKGGRQVPSFLEVKHMLGGAKNSARIDRSVSAYSFPLYFLDMKELLSLLRLIMLSGDIPKTTLAKYVGGSENADRILVGKEVPASSFSNLGILLGQKGRIKGARLSGEQLRSLIDAKVTDGPALRGIRRSTWATEFDNLFAPL